MKFKLKNGSIEEFHIKHKRHPWENISFYLTQDGEIRLELYYPGEHRETDFCFGYLVSPYIDKILKFLTPLEFQSFLKFLKSMRNEIK